MQEAWEIEPLLRVRAFLGQTGSWNDADERSLLAECAALVDAAVREYGAAAKPSTDAMFDHLFANPPRHLDEQRALARKYGGKAGGH